MGNTGSYIFINSWDLRDLGSCDGKLSWDPRDLGSQTEKMSLDPGSYLAELSWDLADLGYCTTIKMSLDLEDPLHPMKFCFRFPIPMH